MLRESRPPRLAGRPPLHPWDTWLNGERHLIQPGQDFRSSVIAKSLRQQIYATAKSRGITVSVELYGDGGGMIVHAGQRPMAKRGRPDSYDWDRLFNGQTHHLHPGADFGRGRVSNFQRTVRGAAMRRGVRVSTRALSDGSVVIFSLAPVEVKHPEVFAPRGVYDPGVDEGSTFEPTDWVDD